MKVKLDTYDRLPPSRQVLVLKTWGLKRARTKELRSGKVVAGVPYDGSFVHLDSFEAVGSKVGKHPALVGLSTDQERFRAALASVVDGQDDTRKQERKKDDRERMSTSRGRGPGDEDQPEPKGGFFMVDNAIFDWRISVPPLVKLVWLCLLRHANGHPKRRVEKLSVSRISAETGVSRWYIMREAIPALEKIGAVKVKRGGIRAGKRLTSEYTVPKVRSLDRDALA